jgi:hypothetical protein
MFIDQRTEGERPSAERPTPSLEGFVAWLERQDPQGTYNYWNVEGDCDVAQYVRSLGYSYSGDYWKATMPAYFKLNIYACNRSTFGEVLEAAREALIRQQHQRDRETAAGFSSVLGGVSL